MIEQIDDNKEFRDSIMGLDIKVPIGRGRYVTEINLDNAATTPPFKTVMDDVMNFSSWCSSIHRGTGYKSKLSSQVYEDGRKAVEKFVGADSELDTVIFTKNTTESINLLAHVLGEFHKDEIIISTSMEHLANDLPWRKRFKVEYVKIDEKGNLLLEDLENKLIKNRGKVRLVTVAGASNVTGLINPIHQIARIAHRYNVEICVDGAQLVPHLPVNMEEHRSDEHIDYLAFSAHKMYAPFGVGVLVGKRKTFEQGNPMTYGGGAVRLVSHDFIEWENPPDKEEAGTPNVLGVKALTSAINKLTDMNMLAIHKRESELIEYTIHNLKSIPGIILYGDYENMNRVSVISFNMNGVDHSTLADIISSQGGIAVRNGLFCAHPYVMQLLKLSNDEIEYYRNNKRIQLPGMVRVSLGLYNNKQDIDELIGALRKISRNKGYFAKKLK